MDEFDRLPTALRSWVADAQLPWSSKSVLRLWQKGLKMSGGQQSAALEFLSECEARKMKEDAPNVWGASFPISERREISRAAIR